MIPAMQEAVLSYLTCKASMFGEAHRDPEYQVRSALHSQHDPSHARSGAQLPDLQGLNVRGGPLGPRVPGTVSPAQSA